VANSSHPLLPTHSGGAVQQLDALFDRACALGASDMHFESGAESFRVRLRLDGRLQVVARPPIAMRDAMVSRIKVMARMDIAEKRLPQDGRMQFLHKGQPVDVRASSLPTVHGEKVVLRLLHFNQERPTLSA